MSFDAPIYHDRIAKLRQKYAVHYSEEIADEICLRLANGETLPSICRDAHMPAADAVRSWALDKPEFGERYQKARRMQHECYADEIVDIADDATNDWMTRRTKSGETVVLVNREHISRSTLRVDSRKWLLSKLNPGQYGDRTQLEFSGKGGGAIKHSAQIVAAIAQTDDPNAAAKLYSELISGSASG